MQRSERQKLGNSTDGVYYSLNHKPECHSAMENEDILDFVVGNFSTLEDQLLDCMNYIPYLPSNMNVVSPKLTVILMESCSLIDSIFRYMESRPQRHQNLRAYSKQFEARLSLEEADSLFLVSPLQILHPFKGWTTTPPMWWLAYNQMKHDRVRNYAAASYALTVLSLVALHQVVARSWIFLGSLAKAGWFNEASDSYFELGASRAAGAGPPISPQSQNLLLVR